MYLKKNAFLSERRDCLHFAWSMLDACLHIYARILKNDTFSSSALHISPTHASGSLSVSGSFSFHSEPDKLNKHFELIKPVRLTNKRRAVTRLLLYVGADGFEPPKRLRSRFTVCPIWPLWNTPENACKSTTKF